MKIKTTPREMGLSPVELEALEAIHYIRPDVPIAEDVVRRALGSIRIL